MSTPSAPASRAAGALARVREVIESEGAVLHPELESRVAEAYYFGDPHNYDPHHVTRALRSLIRDGAVVPELRTTRGGREVKTFNLSSPRTRTRTDRAAARKRLLYGRYLGWAQGTRTHPHGLIGPAGERAIRSALSDAMQPMSPNFGDVRRVFGVTLSGPVDTGGYFVPVVQGIPQPPITTLIEVKNIRSWIYPNSGELYQVLTKGLQAQQADPEQAVVPVLVCRRAHPTLFYMAKQLGFVVIDTRRQWAGPVDEAKLLEVRNELHFTDLHAGSDRSIRVWDRFTQSGLPGAMPVIARQWHATTSDPILPSLINSLRRSLTHAEREATLNDLRDRNRDLGNGGGW